MLAVSRRALGIVLAGSAHHSARCSVASRPTNMNDGVTSLVRKVTTLGQLVPLSKSAQTCYSGRLAKRTRQVTNIIRKLVRVSVDIYYISKAILLDRTTFSLFFYILSIYKT